MVKWSELAIYKLEEIYFYIKQDSLLNAEKVIKEIERKTDLLNNFSEICKVVEEVNDNRIRELVVYSYRIIYQTKNNQVIILNIIHSKQVFRLKI